MSNLFNSTSWSEVFINKIRPSNFSLRKARPKKGSKEKIFSTLTNEVKSKNENFFWREDSGSSFRYY
jgi:hypothetical protein